MNNDICYWRGKCNKFAVGQVMVGRNQDGNPRGLPPIRVGRYCGEHLLLFADLGPKSMESLWVQYDRPKINNEPD